ncbi:chromosome segregation ATPase [Saccharomonospora amisosensis]|uniref:Chromosome segregation ATPase n=1 Tax=Saccharomonospora amisosensis TaxID=1128677 RepID=A0A7X5ZR97_9PSEU|nr:hypothetical protein [Saccharomonospora amisosensis]NIJ12115.1 chromosome segregation ATPase [Saccharomonospora amisosensis]
MTTEPPRRIPPVRRGSRDERRDATVRALAAGDQAYCAYCGAPLPPLPPKGGRPSAYCPAGPDRYGSWGARTITCAMLDEHREIWITVYGADQPMTELDVHTLDERLTAAQAVLDPVRAEIAALHNHATGELAAALAARQAAEEQRDHAVANAEAAHTERDHATAEAEQAREQAAHAREQQSAAEKQASEALAERDHALAARDAAHREAEVARADRQRALDQAAAAQQRIAELQDNLAGERATALERLDQLRREEEQAKAELRTTLTEQWEQRLAAQAEQFTRRQHEVQTVADQRITDLTERLTRSTEHYAASLAPLHDQLAALRSEVAERSSAAATAADQLAELRHHLGQLLDTTIDPATDLTTDEGPLRQRLRTLLDTSAAPSGTHKRTLEQAAQDRSVG